MRVLVVADIFEALSADHPYRETTSREKVLDILRKDTESAICPEAFEALLTFLD